MSSELDQVEPPTFTDPEDAEWAEEALKDITPDGRRRRGSRILMQERKRRAVEMRKAGATYEMIAEQLGYKNAVSASALVKKGIAEITTEPVHDLRTLQYERLNHMLVVLWPKVTKGDGHAISRALQVMDKMDSLMGTEAAQQIEITETAKVMVIDGDKDSYIARLKEMAGQIDPQEARQILAAPVEAEIIEEEEDI